MFCLPRFWQRRHLGAWLGLLVCGAPATAQRNYPFLYAFRAGETLVYETRSQSTNRVEVTADGQARRRLEATVEVLERNALRISVVREDGSAWLAWGLKQLNLRLGSPPQPALEVTAAANGARVVVGDRAWAVPGPGSNDEVLPGLSASAAAGLLAPVRLLLGHDGQVQARDGQYWSERLALVPALAAWATWLQPGGAGLPELPGRALAIGDEWKQERLVPLPLSHERYPVELVHALAGTEVVGPHPTVRVDIEASTSLDPRPIVFEPQPGQAVRLRLESLRHDLSGRLQFDCEHGRLVEHKLAWRVSATGRGDQPAGLAISSLAQVQCATVLMSSD